MEINGNDSVRGKESVRGKDISLADSAVAEA